MAQWKAAGRASRADDDALWARFRAAQDAFFADVEAEADALAARIRPGLLELPDPDFHSLFDNVYAEQTPHLVDQQRWYADYAASFHDGGSGDDAVTGGH